MRVTFSEDGRDFLRRSWSELADADPDGTFFHRPEFLKLYWEEFGETPDHLLLAFAEAADGTQVGAVAFERVGETIRFLGGTEVTDYMGPVGVAELREAIAKELFTALATRDDWAVADLRGLPEDSAWLGLLGEAAAGQGFRTEVTDDQNGVAPFLPLPGTWEEYLEALSSKLRHEVKRKARRLREEAGGYEIRVATWESLVDDLDRFVALHKSSEGPKGVFLQPGMEIFFRRLGEAFLREGVFQLTFLEIGGEKVAGTIGFLCNARYYLYNSAFDAGLRHLSPGMVLVAEDIRIAIERGCSGFDLLKGDYEYKYRFGSRPRPVKRLIVTR
jgi:CelD/BcsL family acetyltransferase involved in cellulose biosynthesis